MADERMQTGRGIAPVVDNPRLARMTAKLPRPTRIAGKILLMAEEPKTDTGKQKRMPPVGKVSAQRAPKVRPDQVLGPPSKAAREAATTKEPAGYVRLRLRVQDGELSVLGAKAVEGPLVESKLQGQLAYEVTLGQKRVAAGAVLDVGERRSFPDPKGKGEQQGHYATPLPSYEVMVRVPKEEVSAASLPRLEIALYRIKEELPVEATMLAAAGPIGPQFEKELREVGRMKGIRPEKLAKAVADEVLAAFG